MSTSGINVTVTYALGNDFGGREFSNNQWVVREARSNTISEKVEQYEKILGRAGYVVENHGEYLAVTGRTN